MTTITNAPRLPGDQPFAPLVSIELLDDSRAPVVGYVSGSGEAIHQRLAFAANGQHTLSESLSEWSVDLVPNAQIEPAGTVYRITEQRGRAAAAIHIVEVPEAGGPYTVLQTLIDEPGSMGSLLLDHLADEVDAHDASSVSVTPAGNLAATDVQAALVELDAQDTAEATARAAADTAEATARAAAIAPLATTASVAAEATARAAADTTLTNNLAAELVNRAAADAAEASTRAAADSSLTTNLAAHEADTLGVHGIANTALLVTTADSRLTDTRTPGDGSVTGGVGAGAKIAANTIVDANVAPAAAIAQSKIAGLTTALADEATARAAADTAATSALASHAADTTAVHGIADTTALVTSADARLTDQRTPLDNSVTQAKVQAGSLGIDRLAVDPRARGTHSGTQAASTISDLGPVVQAYRLDQFAAPTGPLSVNGQRVTNGALPVAGTDLITKDYADALRGGILLKADPVRVMVTTNVNINAPGAVHDGIALTSGVSSVLLTGQTSANDNGIYLYNGAAVPLTRRSDANTDAEMRSGTSVWVQDGTYADQRWTLVTADPIVLGVTAQSWAFDGGLAHVTAGDGLTKTGNTLDVGEGTGMEVTADAVGIAAGGVGTTQLADDAVTTAKIGPGAVTDTEVAAGAAIAQSKVAGLVTDLGTVTSGLAAHLADAVDAHDASAVSFVPAGTIAATTVQAAIEEVATDAAAGLAGHLADAVDAHDASAISFAPAGTLAATDVQAALVELDSEKQPTIAPGTYADAAATTAALGTKTPLTATKPLIVFDGDSMTFGTGAGPVGLAGPSNATYPRLAADGITGATVYNFGVGGQTVLAMTTDAAAQIDVLYDSSRLSIVAVFGGTNDLVNGAASAATVYSRIVTYCQARRAAGWKVVVGTILPRSSANAGAAFEADRQTVNTSIRTNWATFADALADVGADATIGAAGAETNTAYYSDAIHPTTLGYEIVASYFRTAFTALGCLMHTHSVESLWVPFGDTSAALTGGATFGIAQIGPAAIFPATGVPTVSKTIQLPTPFAQWRTLSFLAYWTIQAAGAGTVTWRIDYASLISGFNLATMTNGSGISPTAPAAGFLGINNITNPSPKTVDFGAIAILRVLRIGGTSTADAALLGILIERAT